VGWSIQSGRSWARSTSQLGRASHEEAIQEVPVADGISAPALQLSHHGDSKESWLNEVTDHRVLVDGHRYWVMRLNAKDAATRGIKEGDLIRAYNDRGSVILAAQVGERVLPGPCTPTSHAPTISLW